MVDEITLVLFFCEISLAFRRQAAKIFVAWSICRKYVNVRLCASHPSKRFFRVRVLISSTLKVQVDSHRLVNQQPR